LYADQSGLAGTAQMVERAGEAVAKAAGHFDKHGEIIWILDGIINQFQPDGDQIRADVLAYLDKAGKEALPATADAITLARDYYIRTDHTSAERFDSTLPAVNVAAEGKGVSSVTPGPDNRNQTMFEDVVEPADHLKDVEYDDAAYDMHYKPKWHDFISPSTALRDAIYEVTAFAAWLGICDRAYDPFEVILKPLCGDWVGMARVGTVLEQVSGCLRDVGMNLSMLASWLPTVWDGNAADAADAHLYRSIKSLRAAADSLQKMGAEYRSAAQGAYDIADTVGGLLHDIADAAIAAAAAGMVAGGSASTGVGLPVAALAGIFGMAEIWQVWNGVRTAMEYIAKLESLTATLKSSANGFGAIDGDHPLPSLPAVPALPA
jgi:hypothetical protein